VRHLVRHCASSILAAAAFNCAAAPTDDNDAAALGLESAPVQSTAPAANGRLFVEGVLGAADQRYRSGWRAVGRGAIDWFHAQPLAPGWRAVISDRLDYVRPNGLGSDKTVNSLREAYVGWRSESGDTIGELGRVNLRLGPAYGYNPTDFFRDGSIRTATTVNPVTLREQRLGTAVLRGQRLWSAGSLSVAYAPRLASGPSTEGASLDFGATNNRSRGLVSLGTQVSTTASTNLLIYKEEGLPVQVGANATALLSDAVVAYAEGSRSREPDLRHRILGQDEPRVTRNRFAGGLTYTTSTKLSLTAEYQYNGFAADREGFDNLATNGLGPAYLFEAFRRQDLASRHAFLIYAVQKNAGINNLDATLMVQLNASDHSRLGWLELRYHWTRFDLALQLQHESGNRSSQYGQGLYRNAVQLLGAYYFQ
jgi:hypothetical protein